jgi:hypothetical protein
MLAVNVILNLHIISAVFSILAVSIQIGLTVGNKIIEVSSSRSLTLSPALTLTFAYIVKMCEEEISTETSKSDHEGDAHTPGFADDDCFYPDPLLDPEPLLDSLRRPGVVEPPVKGSGVEVGGRGDGGVGKGEGEGNLVGVHRTITVVSYLPVTFMMYHTRAASPHKCSLRCVVESRLLLSLSLSVSLSLSLSLSLPPSLSPSLSSALDGR